MFFIITGVIYIVLVIAHEMTHFIIFLLQKIKIINLNLFIFKISKQGIKLDASSMFSGYIIADHSDCKTVELLAKRIKQIKRNLLITNIMHGIYLMISIITMILFYRYTYVLYTSIASIIWNALFLMASIERKQGDLYIYRKYSHDDFLSFFATSEIMTDFTNPLIYHWNISIKDMAVLHHHAAIAIIDYMLEYALSKEVNIDDVKINHVMTNIEINENSRFLLEFKMFIIKAFENINMNENQVTDVNPKAYDQNPIKHKSNQFIHKIIHKIPLDITDFMIAGSFIFKSVDTQIFSLRIKKINEMMENKI